MLKLSYCDIESGLQYSNDLISLQLLDSFLAQMNNVYYQGYYSSLSLCISI